MHLSDGARTELKLWIAGYQFPGLRSEDEDSDWLQIGIEARHARGRWRRTDPALLVSEVRQLAEWLDQLKEGKASLDCWFTEPCLSFHRIQDQADVTLLRVHFSHEFAPPWSDSLEGEDLEFPLVELNLKDAAESLRRELAGLPSRAAT